MNGEGHEVDQVDGGGHGGSVAGRRRPHRGRGIDPGREQYPSDWSTTPSTATAWVEATGAATMAQTGTPKARF